MQKAREAAKENLRSKLDLSNVWTLIKKHIYLEISLNMM